MESTLRVFGFIALSFVLSADLAAHADTVSNFSFGGASVFYGLAGDTNLVAGTAAIDITTGVVESASFTAGGMSFSGVDSQAGAEVYVGADSAAALSFSEASLIGYTGSTFNLRTVNDLYVGSLTLMNSTQSPTPAAVTPEPGSLLLLSLGLLGVAGLVWKRQGAHTALGA